MSTATAQIIYTDSLYTFEFIYADTETAIRAIASEMRGSGMRRRKAQNHENVLMNGNTCLTWDIYSDGVHVGYAMVETGVTDAGRAHVIVNDGGRIVGGAYTDGPQDSDDIAMAVAGIVGAYYVAHGDRKLSWVAPSKLTDAQQQNPENGDRWQSLYGHVLEMISRGRPFMEHSYSDGWTITNHIPDCDFCTDNAIVSAWQNLNGDDYYAPITDSDRGTIEMVAREYTGTNGQHHDDWAELGRCTRCAGRNGHRDDPAEFAYSRLDAAWAHNAPSFVREAAERVALDIAPTHRAHRAGEASPAPFSVCVRDLLTGTRTWHQMSGAIAAHDIIRTEFQRLTDKNARNFPDGPLGFFSKHSPDTQWCPGYLLVSPLTQTPIAYADVHFRAVTVATLAGNPGAEIGKLAYNPKTGVKYAKKVTG